MDTLKAWLIVVAIMVLLLVAACADGPNPGYSVPVVSKANEVIVSESVDITGMVWNPVNPPRPGLRCWVAMWKPFNTSIGYAISYCEEVQ